MPLRQEEVLAEEGNLAPVVKVEKGQAGLFLMI